jgi:hypothetical protein
LIGLGGFRAVCFKFFMFLIWPPRLSCRIAPSVSQLALPCDGWGFQTSKLVYTRFMFTEYVGCYI